jgi:hypothetical protein
MCQRQSEQTSIPVSVKVLKVATLFATAAAVALVGCKRAKQTSSPLAKESVQAVPAAHAAPVGYVYITNNETGRRFTRTFSRASNKLERNWQTYRIPPARHRELVLHLVTNPFLWRNN